MNGYLFAENLPSRIQKVDASDYVLPEYDERVRQRRIEVYTASLQAYISFVENWVELKGNTPETREEIYHGDGLNLYAYCKNNPVYYVYPSGHFVKRRQNVSVG